jgi:putative FmdB family regulatory protein
MPIYRYICPKCGKEEKFLHRINEKLEFHCPICKSKMEKTIPSKVGIKFN